MNEFNLTYICRKTGKRYPAKRIDSWNVVLLDEETGERIPKSGSVLKREFKADPKNKYAGAKKSRHIFSRIFKNVA